jgi:glycosidase
MSGIPSVRRFPVLWQLNARTTVRSLGASATLDDLDDRVLDRLVPEPADWLYLLGVWQTGPAARTVSRTHPEVRAACEAALPDLTEDDICGSCFAVTGYQVSDRLGGPDALARLRERLGRRGVRLMLDFVPNHTAPDHPWVAEHPEFYIAGTDADLEREPANWTRLVAAGTERILAHGRDPYFPGWPDTLQLDHSSPAVRDAMTDALLRAAGHADGLRCDMAMLVLPDVFERTWGRRMEPFWPAALARVRAHHPGFTFMAEVYWDREYDLQQQGFDVTYDKRLYDRLVGETGAVRSHLCATPEFQERSARFLENHDEPRAATVFGTGDRHRAAAVVAFLCPGLRFLQAGQQHGRRTHVSMHLCRAPVEADDAGIGHFYRDLLELLDDPVVHDGRWRLLEARSAWEGNTSHERLVASSWSVDDDVPRYVVVANLADSASQAYLDLAAPGLVGRMVTLRDRLGPERHDRRGDDLVARGLYLDVGPWAHQVFELSVT